MTGKSAPRDVLASIPGWQARPATLMPLSGGRNNRSFRVESAGYRYVLRIANEGPVAGGGNRDLEVRVQQQAARRGLASPVLYADTQRGVMLMEYLAGDVLDVESLSRADVLQELGALLRRLHALPPSGVNFTPLAAAEGYLAELASRHAVPKFAAHCLSIIAGTPAPTEFSCCHNDVIASNLIRGNALRLIDFEYACDNDPLFDLASVLCWHNLGEAQGNLLLKAYAGQASDEVIGRLQRQRRLYDALQWLWLAVRQKDFDGDWTLPQMARVQSRLG